MSNIKTKMTALADEVRELSGTTTPKSIDIMTSDVGVANTEIAEQADLITQIKSVVNNLPEAGSSETDITLQNKTVTPTTSTQTVTADSGYNGLGTVIVNAIPNTYIKPIVMQSATTYMPATTDQTIAAGTYCSGMQTIKGDSNLVSENIKLGVSIFGVAGSASAGSGGVSVETVTFSVVEDGPWEDFMGSAFYTDANGDIMTINHLYVGEPLIVAKNTMCVANQQLGGGVECLYNPDSSFYVYRVIGDFYVYANM